MIYYFNDVTQYKILPIHAVKIHTGSGAYSYGLLSFQVLEEGSSLNFRPILTANDIGGESIVAWALEVEAIVLQNNYGDMLPALQALTYAEITDLDIYLKAYTGEPNGEELWITADELLEVNNVTVNWRIEQSSYPAPKLIITAKNVLSKEAISMTTLKLFTQYWSS